MSATATSPAATEAARPPGAPPTRLGRGRRTRPQTTLDSASQAWLTQLSGNGPVHEAAVGRLHALLLTEARHEVRRRAFGLAHPSGRDLDDLAIQAADDALIAILRKLGQFRGDALFTTWARRFATLEVPGEIRRRLGHARDVPTGSENWLLESTAADDPGHRVEVSERARIVGRLVAGELTAHQREVLLAMTIEETSAKALATRLDSTPGAVYKTLHDARRKLRTRLSSESTQRMTASACRDPQRLDPVWGQR